MAALLLMGSARLADGHHGGGEHLRIVTYNVAKLNSQGCTPGALAAVFQALNNDDKPGFAVAPHVYVFQEITTSDDDLLLAIIQSVAPNGVTYSMGTYTNNNENGVAGAQAMVYRSDTMEEITSGHVDIPTGAGRESDRWKLQRIGNPNSAFYIYSSHLKASQGNSNEQTRLSGAIALRNNADALPQGTHIIYAGDFNVYDNGEPAYQHFLSAGSGHAVDPLGSGSWGGSSNAIKHTQSPLCTQVCGLVHGCMDDRFDFQLVTDEWLDGEGLELIPGTYRSFGNDGEHFDVAINDGNNEYYPGDIPRSNALADELNDASDHVPVVVDYEYLTACFGDLDGDGNVNTIDFFALIAAWGPNPGHPADLNGDTTVDTIDFFLLLAVWGPCPQAIHGDPRPASRSFGLR